MSRHRACSTLNSFKYCLRLYDGDFSVSRRYVATMETKRRRTYRNNNNINIKTYINNSNSNAKNNSNNNNGSRMFDMFDSRCVFTQITRYDTYDTQRPIYYCFNATRNHHPSIHLQTNKLQVRPLNNSMYEYI